MKIVFDKVRLSFGNAILFDGLTAEFQSGRSTAIVGANGSGKSTLLKLAGQFIEPDGGTVKALDGDKELLRAEYRRRLAAVAPTMNLYDRLTAEENLKFFAQLRGSTADLKIFDRVGLTVGDAKKLAGEYSTGMKQRLKFAILLTANADVWLLDEPGANLDDEGRSMVLNEISKAVGEGKLILLATNDPVEAAVADEQLQLNV